MKKNIFKYTLPLALGVFSLAACNDDDEVVDSLLWEQPAQTAEANDDYADISFVEATTTKELDPTDPTSYTLHMSRRNTSGAITVPITITNGADTIFTVSDAVFQDGDSIVEFTISFDKAEVGTKYTAVLNVNDPAFTSPYSNAASATFSVTRVKWNPVGYVMEEDEKKEGWAMYTEDLVSSYWSIEQASYPVRLQERADRPGMFRLVNPYNEKWPYASYADGSKEYYIVIDATDPDNVFIVGGGLIDLGVTINGKDHLFFGFTDYYAQREGVDLTDKDQLAKFKEKYPDYFGKYANGKITFPEKSFLQVIGGEGYFYGNSHGAFCVVVDPSKDLYEYTVENDFDWEEVFTGNFASGKLGTKSEATLYKGVPADTTTEEMKDAYERFTKAYGTPYILAAPYAEDYNIYFAVKDGRIQVLPDYELQETGIDALGEPAFARLNAGQSSWSEKVVSLNITFTNEDESIEYGTTDEVLSNITYTTIGTGDFLSTVFFTDYDEATNTESPYLDAGLELQQRDDDPTQLRLLKWGYGVEFYFTFDPEKGVISVPEQFTGYVYPGMGNINVSDVATFNSELAAKYPNSYDAETDTIYFNMIYTLVGTNYSWNGVEKLKLNIGDTPAGVAPKYLARPKKQLRKFGYKRENRFVGKRVAKNTMRCIQPSKAVIK